MDAATDFDGKMKSWKVVRRMRWLTLLLGPFALALDEYVQPWLMSRGYPSILTMEDVVRVMILDLLGLSKWMDLEQFLTFYTHLRTLSCYLFVLFVVWEVAARRRAIHSAGELPFVDDEGSGD